MAKKNGGSHGVPVIGFEKPPQGKLLSQFVDFDHPLGCAYERCIGYFKDFHTHDRINLTFPRASSIIGFQTKAPNDRFRVDENSVLWMPADAEHSQDTLSTVYDNLALFPTSQALDSVLKRFVRRYGVAAMLPKVSIKKQRSALLKELLDEYFIERVIERKDPHLLDDLGRQILEETLRIIICPKRSAESEEAGKGAQMFGDPMTAKAVRFLEAHLFQPFSSDAVSEYAGTSQASLFRKFRAELGMTPGEYVTSRRLDESIALLKSNDYTVSDIALIVGYADLASFSKAFKSKYGRAPSIYLSKKR